VSVLWCFHDDAEGLRRIMQLIVGVDECGYGSIAGSLVVAAVAFSSTVTCPSIAWASRGRLKQIYVQDSKKIPREFLAPLAREIEKQSVARTVLVRPAEVIDRLGIWEARREAMVLAIQRVVERCALINPANTEELRIIVDGDLDLGNCSFPYEAIAHADRDFFQVGAASILAKEIQLQIMQELHKLHPQYDFYHNAGYPTPMHIAMLKKHGITKYHRKSYKTVQELLP
jgi:ribonuclease HII